MSVIEQSFGPFKELELKLPEGAKDEEQFNKVLDTVLCSSVRPKKH